ncbi:MAG: translocation/assembly module TamB domain-containing protein [Elusimicrobiota bacterium]
MRKLLWGALLAVFGLFAVIGVFLTRPQTLINGRTAGAAIRYFGAGWSPRWSRLTVAASALGSRRHRYVLIATDFCAADARGVFSGCFSDLELSAVVFYSRGGPVLERVENLVAVSDKPRLDLRRLGPRAARGGGAAGLIATPVRALRLELSRFTLMTSSSAVSGSLRAALTPGVRRPLSFAADLAIRSPGGARRLKGDLTADTDLLAGAEPTYADVSGRFDLGRMGRARVSFRARREAGRYAVTGGAEITASTGPVSSLRLAACAGAAPWDSGAARPSSAALSCRYEAVLRAGAAGMPAGITGAKGGVAASVGLKGEAYTAAVKADLEPLGSWYELTGNAALQASGRLDRPLSAATLSHEVHATVKVPRFEELVALLRDTRYAVPPPIHVLKGPLALTLVSLGDPRSGRQAVRYLFSSDLTGGKQRLILRADGEVRIIGVRSPARGIENDGKLVLKDVALELPRLDLGSAPKVMFDKRITAGPLEPEVAAKTAPGEPSAATLPAIRSRLTIKTEKPLILYSNLLKDPVPVALDLTATYPPGAAAGLVSVQRFDVELFRRNATVDHLNVVLSSGPGSGALEGLVRYKTPAASISILLLGTAAKPRVEFVSVPPMKREDILALLIFGKSPDELDPEQTASVGNTETALESRAFGLASLYLFGATPIEHVGYDSATKTATIVLRLPGGANLTLGSDFDQGRQLSVRKPIAPHWAIQSEITDQAQQSRAAATFLEWFNRY